MRQLRALIYAAEEGGYWAKVPALPGCVTQGETLEEVKHNLVDAVEAYLAVANETTAEEDGKIVEEVCV